MNKNSYFEVFLDRKFFNLFWEKNVLDSAEGIKDLESWTDGQKMQDREITKEEKVRRKKRKKKEKRQEKRKRNRKKKKKDKNM